MNPITSLIFIRRRSPEIFSSMWFYVRQYFSLNTMQTYLAQIELRQKMSMICSNLCQFCVVNIFCPFFNASFFKTSYILCKTLMDDCRIFKQTTDVDCVNLKRLLFLLYQIALVSAKNKLFFNVRLIFWWIPLKSKLEWQFVKKNCIASYFYFGKTFSLNYSKVSERRSKIGWT